MIDLNAFYEHKLEIDLKSQQLYIKQSIGSCLNNKQRKINDSWFEQD